MAQMAENPSAMQETQVQSLDQKDPLKKSMAMHSRILAWRIPWTEESGGLQSTGSQRVDKTEQLTLSLSVIKYGTSQMALVLKNPLVSAGNIRDMGSIPGSGRSTRGGHGNPLQFSCLENPMDRGTWRATVQGRKELIRLKLLSTQQELNP